MTALTQATVLQVFGSADPARQTRALELFERLKLAEGGWTLCAEIMTTGSGDPACNDHVKFFCFQVIEHHVRRIIVSGAGSAETTEVMKRALMAWLAVLDAAPADEKAFIKNKAAQVFSLVCVADFPARWPTFFADITRLNVMSPRMVDMFYRILKAVDSEVVDREIPHTPVEAERNTLIKDTMRETAVTDLVENWYQSICRFETSHPDIVAMCHEVIGAYISWIDIALIANDRFVAVFLRHLRVAQLRETAAECLTNIVSKGMEPVAKIKLVESYMEVLEAASLACPPVDEDADYVIKMSTLVNCMGIQLLDCWKKFVRGADGRHASECLVAFEKKVPYMLRFFSDEDDDVSLAICPFTYEYISTVKQLNPMSDQQKSNVVQILHACISKMKYDADYDFEGEGEEEAEFLAYRKQLKVIFDFVAKLDPDLIMRTVHGLVVNALNQWRSMTFGEVEVAIRLLYNMAEALPALGGGHFTGDSDRAKAMIEMMSALIVSGVSRHDHHAVVLQYFETVVRYHRFFPTNQAALPDVLISFIDDRGLRHRDPKVRGRVSYLFTRFVKEVKPLLHEYTEDILERIKDLLVIRPPASAPVVAHREPKPHGVKEVLRTNTGTGSNRPSPSPSPSLSGVNGSGDSASSLPPPHPDDQMYIFEVASVLIVSGQFSTDKKQSLMHNLLSPIVTQFGPLMRQMETIEDEEHQSAFGECLVNAVTFATRVSKAFSNQQTMKMCGCTPAFVETLQVFLTAFDVKVQRQPILAAVRTYFHRMVVCLEDEIMAFVPVTVDYLLRTAESKTIVDFIPLLNQIVGKFKKNLVPYLQHVFMPIVHKMWALMSEQPVDDADSVLKSEREALRRAYFTFLQCIVTQDVVEVISTQDANDAKAVLESVVRGAVEIPDPVTQKLCFSILRSLVEKWGDENANTSSAGANTQLAAAEASGFRVFIYENIIPACFQAPLQPHFDLNDGAYSLAAGECAMCLKTLYEKRGEEFVEHLRNNVFLPLNVNAEVSAQFFVALKRDPKDFKKFILKFFQMARDSTKAAGLS